MEDKTNIKSVVFEDINNFCQNRNLYKAIYINIHKLDNKVKTSVVKGELANMFVPLIRDGYAKSFVLQNEDVLFVYNKSKEDDVSSLLVKIKFLFNEDEQVKNASNLDECGIVAFFDVESDYALLVKKVEKSFVFDQTDEKVKVSQNFTSVSNVSVNKKDLTTEALSKVQKIISISDFSSFVRRQAVCAIIGKAAPQRIFEEVFVSVEDVRDSLLPGVNIKSNPWLNLVLTDTLNKRILEIASRHDDGALSGNFSINIGVSTILSDEFIQFDDSINGSMRQTIILELQLEDIFSDMNAYILAKTFAKVRGYKICIDGINADKLKYINRKNLDCDLMKIEWHPSLIDIFSKDKHFMDYMNKAERAKIIFYNINDQEAIDAGNNLGISLYQGKFVQKMLNEANSIKKN